MLLPLGRRALAEFLGTAALVAAVVGSGIAAQRFSPGDAGLQLLENSIATVLALVAIQFSLGPVSGSHLNPVVSAGEWARGLLPLRDALAYSAAQFAGGIVGALLANAMFGLPLLEFATHVRTGSRIWLGEVVATSGLLLAIHGTALARPSAVPYAVAAWIGAAYWFTSSTSFANPAVTLARSLSDSFAGISPSSVPPFLLSQLLGAALGFLLLRLLLPRPPSASA